MSRASRSIVVTIVALLGLAALGACTEILEAPASLHADTARLLERVNAARATGADCGSAGVFAPAPPVALEVRLAAAAQEHTLDMQDQGFISHTGSDGSGVGERLERHGYTWLAWGENVASGFRSADAVMDAWMASPGHCANVMRERYTELGVGRAGLFWTQVFARPD